MDNKQQKELQPQLCAKMPDRPHNMMLMFQLLYQLYLNGDETYIQIQQQHTFFLVDCIKIY